MPRMDRELSTPQDPKHAAPWALVILIALIVYVGGYAIGIGNVAWQRKHLQDLFVA